MAKSSLHRGELLKRIVEGSGVGIMWLVKKAGYKSKTSYYNHIEEKNLSVEILLKYGEALNYDFSVEIPEIKKAQSILANEAPKTLQEAKKQIEYWKTRYYDLLEKYNQIIEKQLKS